MNKMKFTTMKFQEGGYGSAMNVVGKKSLFKSEKDFLDMARDEYEIDIDELNEVYVAYVRYYPCFGEDSGMEIESGYTFCNKARGAMEVYCLDLI